MSFAIRDFFYCIGFLSRIPVPNKAFTQREESNLAQYVALFPLAGLVIALPACLAALLCAVLNLPPNIAALIITMVEIITIGALHEDGLADCADGFYGGHEKERRLAIMKDSTIGTYGGIALIISIALRAACLAVLWASLSMIAFLCVLLALASASRGGMAFFWPLLPPARDNGLAAHAGVPQRKQTTIALAIAIALFITLIGLALGLWAVIMAGTFAMLIFATFLHLTKAKIGGHTGDTLGAVQQLIYITLLIGLVASQ